MSLGPYNLLRIGKVYTLKTFIKNKRFYTNYKTAYILIICIYNGK